MHAKTVKFLDLKAINALLGDELKAAAAQVIDSGWYIMGPQLEAFETEYAAYAGAQHCVGVANGLDALSLTLRAWDVGPGDEVIVPSNTYIATWLAASSVGARVVAVEPDPATYNIDPERIRDAITPRTKVVIPVHLYGQAADMGRIMQVADQHGLRVLADGAQSQGACWAGRPVGAYGHATAWSFYPGKNLGALGDAGAVTTDDESLARRLRTLRNYGSNVKYVNLEKGVNSRLDELQAALLRVKLRHLDAWNLRRVQTARKYTEHLSGVALPALADGASSVWHVYVIGHPQRDRLQEELRSQGVETLIHYPTPPHLQQAYAELGQEAGTYPISEALHREVLSLPIGPHLSDEDEDHVVRAVTAAAHRLQ